MIHNNNQRDLMDIYLYKIFITLTFEGPFYKEYVLLKTLLEKKCNKKNPNERIKKKRYIIFLANNLPL